MNLRDGFRVVIVAVLLGGLSPGVVRAQSLTLGAAMRRADSAAFANRIARGNAAAQAGLGDQALQGILPSLRMEGGWMRTTDPLNAFGFLLRQRAVTPASFDPALLNDPAARSNYSGSLILEQPLVNPDVWFARAAAGRATDAQRALAGWTRVETRVDVLRAYYGAVLASQQVGTLETALRAANQHVRQAETMARNGMVTRSDVLLAEVRSGQVESRLLAARGDAETAKRQLALLLGDPADTAFTLPDSLPPGDRIREWIGAGPAVTGDLRLDVQSARFARDAAGRDAARAAARLLPRVNAFGRLDWFSLDQPFGGKESWTVGVMVVWSPWSGGAELADRRAARARRDAASAMADAAAGRAQVEAQQRESDVAVARATLEIAERAVAQASEAHRIVARKYEGGLAGVVDLLDAQATDTESRLRLAQARYQLIVAAARLWQAQGADLSWLTGLEETR